MNATPSNPPLRSATRVALLCACALAPLAPAQNEPATLTRVLVTEGLQQRTVQVISLSEQELVALDALSGGSIRVPLSSVRALLPVVVPLGTAPSRRTDATTAIRASRRLPPDTTGLLILADAQSLPGQPGPATLISSADALPWQSVVLGQLSIPLDAVRSVLSSRDTPRRAPGATADRVYLRNGDQAEGFVELAETPAGGGRALAFRVEVGDRASTLPWPTIESVEFGTPITHAGGGWAWLDDGTAITTNAIAIADGSRLTLSWTDGESPTTLPAASLLAYVPSRERLGALSAAPVTSVSPGSGRRWAPGPGTPATRPVPMDAGDIELQGPVSVTWDVGTDAQRIAGSIEMPPGDRVWGDCVVVAEFIRSNF